MSRYSDDDDPPAQVWDRSRFEAARRDRGDVPVMERERYEERDTVRVRERTPPRRETYFRESEEYDSRPRRERYYEEEERDTYEGAMVHKPRDRGEERDIEIDIRRREYDRDEPRRPSRQDDRPTFVRRQSSLDTHDRRPMPRPGDWEHEHDRRRSSARRDDWYEEDYRYQEDTRGGYREREVERIRRRRSPSPESTVEEREEVVEEKVEEVKKEFPKRGKTKMPKRLVHKTALFELGYPYEEQGETIIILYALGREDIDEVIALSKQMWKDGLVEEISKTVIYDRKASREEPRVVERRKEVIREASPPSEIPASVASWDAMAMKQSDWHKRQVRGSSPDDSLRVPHHHRRRRRSRAKSDAGSPRRAVLLEEREESAELTTGVGALVLKPQKHRRSKSIQKEILELETEREVLRKERRRSKPKVEVIQGTEIVEAAGPEIVIADEDDAEIVEVKREKKTPDPRVFRAMLATLT